MAPLRLLGIATLALAVGCAKGESNPDASGGGTGADADVNAPDADVNAPDANVNGTPDAPASSFDATPGYDGAPMYDATPNYDAPPIIAQSILLMGEDVDATGWDAFRNALTAAGATWTEIDLVSISDFPSAQDLAAYDTVIWFDESVIGPGDTECQRIVDWLDTGGKNLFTASVDFVWDFANGAGGLGENNLYVMMGVTYLGDYAGTAIATLDGAAADPIGGDFLAPSGLALAGTSDSDGDYYSAGTATIGGLYATGGSGSGSGGISHRDAGTYKIVTLGVNFHNGLSNAAQRNTLMANVLAYFSN